MSRRFSQVESSQKRLAGACEAPPPVPIRIETRRKLVRPNQGVRTGRSSAVTLASQIVEAADRSTRAVGILLDFTRTRLGEGIPVDRADASMDTLVRDVAARIAAAHSERRFSVKTGASYAVSGTVATACVSRLSQTAASVGTLTGRIAHLRETRVHLQDSAALPRLPKLNANCKRGEAALHDGMTARALWISTRLRKVFNAPL
jgi:hypothetical protein